MSKGALCATSTESPANSRNAGSASPSRGASPTIASLMPVSTEMKGGIGTPGLTSVWNSPSRSPPRTFTAPISVISQLAGDPPVVSRSTTTKVTSCSGVPSSSNVACTATPAVSRPGTCTLDWYTSTTLGRPLDTTSEAHRPAQNLSDVRPKGRSCVAAPSAASTSRRARACWACRERSAGGRARLGSRA